jgi:DNA-binding transcriptional LysR family regulator
MTLLRYVHPIVALAEHRHFGRAARALGISQPALSMAIRRAERELQARLFDRNHGAVTLTPFGESAVRRCRDLLHSAREIVREVDLLRGLGAGRLVVTCGTYPAELSGHRAIGRLVAAHPGLACSIRLSEWHRSIQPVITHEADVALAEVGAAEADPRLVAEVIGTHPCRFFCRPGHALLRQNEPTIGQLASYPWALTSLPPRIFAMIDEPACAAGRLDEAQERFIPAIHVETLQAAKDVVRESDAISAAPPILLADDVRAGRIGVVRYAAPWVRLNYGFIYLRDRMLSPAARAYMNEVRRIEAEVVRATEDLESADAVEAGCSGSRPARPAAVRV